MTDQTQREVRMSSKKRSGNKPRMLRRAHKSLKPMWRDMAAWYQDGAESTEAVRVQFPERKPERKQERGADLL